MYDILPANTVAGLMADITSLNEAIDYEYKQSVEASNTWMVYRTCCAARDENPGRHLELIRLAYPLMETGHLSEMIEQELVSY